MKNQLCWFFWAAVTGGIVNSDMKIVSIPMLLGVPEAMSTAESEYGFTLTTHNKTQ